MARVMTISALGTSFSNTPLGQCYDTGRIRLVFLTTGNTMNSPKISILSVAVRELPVCSNAPRGAEAPINAYLRPRQALHPRTMNPAS